MKDLCFLILCSSSLILNSCQKEAKPEHLIPKEKMVQILLNLHMAEAFINSNYAQSDSSRFLYKKMEDSTLKRLEVDQILFDSSMAYYKKNIKLMDEIYVSVVDSLSLKEGLQK